MDYSHKKDDQAERVELKTPYPFLFARVWHRPCAKQPPGLSVTLPAVLLVWLFARLGVLSTCGVSPFSPIIGIYLCARQTPANRRWGSTTRMAIVWDTNSRLYELPHDRDSGLLGRPYYSHLCLRSGF